MMAALIRLQLFLARHRWALAICLIAAAACFALTASRLQVNEDFRDMLPLSDPRIAEFLQASDLFRQTDRLLVDVSARDAGAEALFKAADDMAQALATVPDVGSVRYSMEAGGTREAFRLLLEHLPCLLDREDQRTLETHLQPSYLQGRLEWFKRSLAEPQGAILKDVAVRDPIGFSDALKSKLDTVQAGFGGMRVISGRITSPDGRHVLITATPSVPISDTRRSAPMVDAVLSAAQAVEQRFRDAGIRVAVGGGHRVALDNARCMKNDGNRCAAVEILIVVALVWSVYRRRRLALLTVVPSLLGMLTSMTVLFWTGDTISGIALGFGSILIGITIDDAFHVIYHLEDDQPPDRRAAAELVARLAVPIVSRALIIITAFLIMLFSPVAGHRQVGVYAATGVGVAAVLAILALPPFVPLRRGLHQPPLRLTLLFERLFLGLTIRARILMPALVAFSLLCAWGLTRLRFDGDISRLNYMSEATARDARALESAWGQALSLTTVIVKGATLDEALQKNERVRALLARMESQKAVGNFSSVAEVLPSRRTQEANLAQWRSFWSAERRERLRSDLTVAAARLGFRAEAFEPFLDSLSSPPDVLTAEALRQTPVGDRIAEYIRQSDGAFAVATLVKIPDRAAYERLRERVQALVPGALLANRQRLADSMEEISKEGIRKFGLVVAVADGVLLLLLLGRPLLALATLLPVAMGLFWTLGLLGLIGYSINMANFLFVVFVVGVGIDYSLFLVTGKLESVRGFCERMGTTGGSVTICAFTTLFGVGTLVIARHPALFSVGVTGLLDIGCCLLSAMLLAPLMMDRLLRPTPQPRADANDPAALRRAVGRLFRYQGPYVENYVFWKMRTDPVFPALHGVVPAEGAILDLGTGYGLVAHWLSACSSARAIIGVDHDEDKIRVARATARGNSALAFETQDLLAWPFPAADAALLVDVLHYFPREDKLAILRKTHGALRPGGRLVIRDAGRDASAGHLLVALAEKWAVWIGHNKTAAGLIFDSAEEQVRLLQEAGFIGGEVRRDSGLGSNILITARKPA